MSQIALTPSKTRFQAGVAFAKKIGCRFDAGRKVWTRDEAALWSFVDSCRFQSSNPELDESRDRYLLKNGLVVVGGEFDREPHTNNPAAVSPAQRWVGQASMDHPDSHF